MKFWTTKIRFFVFLSKFQAREPECGLRVIAGWQNRVRACEPTSSSPGSITSLVMGRVHFLRVRVEYESNDVEYGPSTSLRVSRDSLPKKFFRV